MTLKCSQIYRKLSKKKKTTENFTVHTFWDTLSTFVVGVSIRATLGFYFYFIFFEKVQIERSFSPFLPSSETIFWDLMTVFSYLLFHVTLIIF